MSEMRNRFRRRFEIVAFHARRHAWPWEILYWVIAIVVVCLEFAVDAFLWCRRVLRGVLKGGK